MAPDAIEAVRQDTCGIWSYAAPWPDLPGDIAFTSLRFTPDRLLASRDAGQIDLPEPLRPAHAKRRADYIGGRLCARSAIRQMNGQCVQVGRQPDGSPSWPTELCGSISHAGGLAVAVAAPLGCHSSLGVDVESILPPAQANALSPMILTPSERARFGECPPALVTTAIFSLKEALFKLLHPLTGRMFFHEQAEVAALLPNGHAILRLLATLSTQWRAGSTLPALWHHSGGSVFSIATITDRL